MRLFSGILLLLLLAGCGGGASISPPPPPPPSPPGPPASLAVQQGDGQTGEIGVALAVHPAVVVKDASGRAVSNVAVTFAVDSGGGSIAGGSVTTGGDGMATAGAWTLGAAEGRNVLVASVAGVPAVRLVATAIIPTTDIADVSVPAGGGAIVISRPGTPVDGMRIDVPSGAFAAPVQFQVRYSSSAALPHVADVTVASPIITVTSTATGPAQAPFSIRIPATIGSDEFPIIAMVDPATGFLDALPTVSYDQAGVTASGMILDETQLLEDPAGSSFRISRSSAVQGPRARFAVLLAKLSLLHTVVFNTGFVPGVDDWEFPADATPVFTQTDAGQVVAERFYFRTRKSQTSGPLWNKFMKAPGAVASDAAGYRWSAGLAKQFHAQLAPQLAGAVAARAANQIAYDRNFIQQVTMSFIASGGAPQIVAFYNPAANDYRTVLAYSWDGPSGLLYVASPPSPGDATKKTSWNSNGFASCTVYCVAISGLNHLIGYQAQLNAEFPQVVAGTINQSLFPSMQAASSSPIIGPAGGNDTLFVVDDTARVWVECATCPGQAATTVQRQHGAAGLQSQRVYVEDQTGQWPLVPGSSTANGFLVDVTKLPSANANHYASFRIGVEARTWNSASTGPNATTGWGGWKVYRVLEFAPTLTMSQGAPLVATIAVGTQGGPQLPPNLDYVFKWGDGTADLVVSGRPSSVQHTYAKAGKYNVTMEIRHTHGNELVGRVKKLITVTANIVWRLTQLQGTALTSSPPFDPQIFPDQGGINNSLHITLWRADSALIARVESHPETGLLVYLPQPVVVGQTTYRAGLYLQSDPAGTPGATAVFDPTQQLIPLARTPAPPFPDVYPPNVLSEPFADLLTVTNTAISGGAIGPMLDFTGLPATAVAPQKKRVLVAWDVATALNGAVISGTTNRTQSLWAYLPNSGAHGVYFYGRLKHTFTFSATRVP